MFRLRLEQNGTARRSFAWIGVVLFVCSIVWLELLPPREAERSTSTTTVAEGPLTLVVIDPGHGGKDSGAIHSGVAEKDLTLDVAQRLARLVELQGLAAVLTRNADEFISLADRAALANSKADCVFISIHFDEAQRAVASGVTTFYAGRQATGQPAIASWVPFLQRVSMSGPSVESQSLAGFIQQAIISRTQAPDRGTQPEQFYVIANVRHPAVLVEGGFLTNKDELNKLNVGDYRQLLAAAIGEGIRHYRDAVRARREAAASEVPGT